jgi:hypothetical protein
MARTSTTVLVEKITSLLDEHIQEIHEIQETTERLVSSIPFVQKLIQENNTLKKKIEERNTPFTENISLEISDTKVVNMDPDNTPDLRTQQLLFHQFNETTEQDSLSMGVRNGTISPSSYGSGIDSVSNEGGGEGDDEGSEGEAEEEDTEVDAEIYAEADEEEVEEQEAEEDEDEEEDEAEEDEAEEDEVEEDEAEVEEDEAEEDEAEEDEEDEEEAEEVEEIQINGTLYYTTDKINGNIYSADLCGEPASYCGHFVNGQPHFDPEEA